jgi:hypothetical protein
MTNYQNASTSIIHRPGGGLFNTLLGRKDRSPPKTFLSYDFLKSTFVVGDTEVEPICLYNVTTSSMFQSDFYFSTDFSSFLKHWP